MARTTSRQTSTARVAALAQLKREQARRRRRSRLLMAAAVVGAVALVVAAVVAVGLRTGGGDSQDTTPASPALVAAVAGVPAATYDAVGVGSAKGLPSKIDGAALTADGKPRMLYLGAEYCPFCAAQRWAVVAALSRFGTFTGLGQTASAHDDVFPDTPTLSFHGSTYTSDYLSFTGVEQQSNQREGGDYAPLDKLSAADATLVDTYNQPPYVQSAGSIPFTDIGGRYVTSGASFSPDLLAGMTQAEVAKAMQDPDSDVARAVDGAANAYTAAICDVTEQQPAAVCTSSGVTTAAKSLGGS